MTERQAYFLCHYRYISNRRNRRKCACEISDLASASINDLEGAYPWAGTFAETKDGLAYIGSVPDFPRYLFALGFGGNGITYGAIAAEIIRDQLLQRPNAAARLFRFDR